MKPSFTRSCVIGIVSLASSSALVACGASSNSEVMLPVAGRGPVAGKAAAGSGGAGGGEGGAQSGTGGSVPQGGAGGSGAGGGGAQSGAGGSSPQGGSGGAGGSGGSAADGGSGGDGSGGDGSGGDGSGQGGSCEGEFTTASHVVISVQWEATTATKGESGTIHLWTKSHFNRTGNSATVESTSCGTILPAITPSTGANFFIGSKKILPEIPDAAWDAAGMPKFTGTATWSDAGHTIDPGVALLGLSLSDPESAWPAEGADITTTLDHDGDGKAGITANSTDDATYQAAPTKLAFNPPRADKIYLAIRNSMTLSSNETGCPDETTGTVAVKAFDNHVIGCHVNGGDECTDAEAKFVDDNRTVYEVTSATFRSTIISDSATCADVRAALPVE